MVNLNSVNRKVSDEEWQAGKVIAQRRRSDVVMNTEVRTLKDED
jgi:hypothetical protein